MEVNIPTSIGRRLEEFFLRTISQTNNQTPSQSSVLAGDHRGSKFLFTGYHIILPYLHHHHHQNIYIYCYYCCYYYQYLVDEFGQNMGGFHPVAPVAAAALPPEVQNAPCWTGKHSSPEGRNSAKNEPKRCLTSVLKL